MNTTKKLSPLAGLFLFIAKAAAVTIIGLVMAITVLVVGGVVAYKMIQFFHSPAWTNPGGSGEITTNTVSKVTIFYDDQTTQTSIQGELDPGYWMQTNGYGTYASGSPVGGGFAVTYGLDMVSNPIVTLDNSPMALTTTTATGSNFTFSVALNLGIYSDVISFSSTDMMDAANQGEFDLYTRGTGGGSATNAYGDVATDTGAMVSTNLVVLQRTTDLQNWTNILTNLVCPGVLQTYNDTNTYPTAFYRLGHVPGQ